MNVSFTKLVRKEVENRDPSRFFEGQAHDCPMKSAPPFVSTSPAPHLCEEGQPKNAGEARIIFVCPSPTRVGAAVVEVMGGDDLLGQRNGPSLPESLPRRILHL